MPIGSPVWDLPRERRVFDAARDMLQNTTQTARNQIDDRQTKRTLSDRHGIEWHRKIFLSVACILLFLIGAPLGRDHPKGGLGLPTVLAILLFVLYYVVTIMGERMVRSGALSPLGACGWAPHHGARSSHPAMAGSPRTHVASFFQAAFQPVLSTLECASSNCATNPHCPQSMGGVWPWTPSPKG